MIFNRVTLCLRMVLLLVATLLAACSATSSGNAQLSPTAIIVRNNSGSDFASASLVAVSENSQAARAYGELAPIPDRIEQVYGRPTRAAPLPEVVEFRLQTLQRQTLSRIIRLDSLPSDKLRPGAPYVLVFVLEPGGQIRPLLENQ